MEYKRYGSAKASRSRQSGSMGTVAVIAASVLLIAAIIVVSPLGNRLFGVDVFGCITHTVKTEDDRIVSALKQQETTASPGSEKPMQSEQTHKNVSAESMPFYILQMGAYTDRNDAQEQADRIRQLGAGGKVFEEGSVFRVFAAAYMDENSLMKVHAQVRADGFEATPYITEKKTFRLTLDGDKEAVSVAENAVKLLNNVPSALCELCLSYDKGEADDEAVKAKLSSLQRSSTECIQSAEKMNVDSIAPILNVIKSYAENISTFLEEHDTIDAQSLSGELKYLQLSVITDYILFFSQE